MRVSSISNINFGRTHVLGGKFGQPTRKVETEDILAAAQCRVIRQSDDKISVKAVKGRDTDELVSLGADQKCDDGRFATILPKGGGVVVEEFEDRNERDNFVLSIQVLRGQIQAPGM